MKTSSEAIMKMDEIGKRDLLKEIEELRKDRERLEWIFNHLAKAEQTISDHWSDTYGDPSPISPREAIDAAMKESGEK